MGCSVRGTSDASVRRSPFPGIRAKPLFALRVFISYSLLMNKRALFLIFVSVLSGLNLGSIRKAEDPIRDTQTNPILYEQKKEEEKDGKKGPLMYNVKNNPRESFFIDPPYEKAKKGPSQEIVTEKVASSTSTSGWWEEQSTDPQKVSSDGKVSEPLPEPSLEVEKGPEAAEPSAAAPEAEDAKSGKGDDYWW
jgi:hypothetical protein